MTTEHNPVELFYSYSHRDEDLRDELEKQLTPLRRQGVISNWHDRRIGAGTEWKSQIDEHLNSAHIILLLVSADFLASDYCYDVELARAIERHQAGEARVIPVILRACDWKSSLLGKLQALPRDGIPVTDAHWSNLDEAFLNVVQGIRQTIEGFTVPTITIAEPVMQEGAAEHLELSATQQDAPRRQGSLIQPRKDVFLSHAFEDKAKYVTPLAEELDKRGISYWLDEAEIKWGERITTRVNEGLAMSRYVVVVLSDNFIGKGWPEAELSSALNHETSNGQTTVLPLITTDPENVFQRYPLLRDKLYLHWDKGLSIIVDRLSDLLHYAPTQNAIESEGPMTEPETPEVPQASPAVPLPLLTETSIHFSYTDKQAYDRISQRLFAIITQWVEFEEVQGSSNFLEFPSGRLSRLEWRSECVLSILSPGIIPLHQILAELGKGYPAIEFQTSRPFDLGDLVRRSRENVRNITLISPSNAELTLHVAAPGRLDLKVENLTGQNGSITVRNSSSRQFEASKPPIPYTTALRYLMEDPPPTEALINAAQIARGET